MSWAAKSWAANDKATVGTKAMNALIAAAVAVCALFLLGLAVALYLVASPTPPMSAPKDVFDFTSLRAPPSDIPLPSLRRYAARDGEELAYRIYEFDVGPHPYLCARLVLSRRRLSWAGGGLELRRRGEGRAAKSARALPVRATPRRRRIHRPTRRRHRRSDRSASRAGPQRSRSLWAAIPAAAGSPSALPAAPMPRRYPVICCWLQPSRRRTRCGKEQEAAGPT